MAMTWNEQQMQQLLACLEHTEEAHRLAKRGIKKLRHLIETREMAIHLKERYQKQIRMLRRIAKGTKQEMQIIQSLIVKIRGETPHPHEIRDHATQT
jgi:hypothetical protein